MTVDRHHQRLPENNRQHGDLTMFGAEAAAAKAPAIAVGKSLSLADRCAVAFTNTRSLEPVALGFTSPCLCHH